MILATVLGWTLMGQAGGSSNGPWQSDRRSGTAVACPWLEPVPFSSILAEMLEPGRAHGPIFPGSASSIEQATEKAHTIVIGRPTTHSIIIGLGAVSHGTYDFESSSTLKGEAKTEDWKNLGVQAVGREVLPEVGRGYIVFIATFKAHDRVVKMLPMTDENIETVKPARIPSIESFQSPKAIAPMLFPPD